MAASKNAPEPAAPRANYHRGNVAEDLRKVAEHILATETLEHVTVRRLSRELGVTPGNFYNHYPSIDFLVLDIAREAFDRLEVVLQAAAATKDTKVDRLISHAQIYVRFGVAQPELVRVMFGRTDRGTIHPGFRAASLRAFVGMAELIYGEGGFDLSDTAAAHRNCPLAYSCFALCIGLARTIGAGQFDIDLSRSEDIDRFVDLTVRPMVQGAMATF